MFGFIMGNPISSTSTYNCIPFDYTQLTSSAQVTMPSTTASFTSISITSNFTNTLIALDSALTGNAVTNFNILDQPSQCPQLTYALDWTPMTLPDQLFEVGSASGTYTAPAFALTTPVCTDTIFSSY